MEEEGDEIVPFSPNSSPTVGSISPVRGMESVVASVSGYHGTEKFKLIKLINQSGASYVGTMTKSTTHLVCWQFEGRKYNLAKSVGTKVVNHRWFEDCVKERRRIPEGPYLMESGKQVGPLLWEVPDLAAVPSKKGHLLTRKNKKVFIDLSNTFNDSDGLEIGTRSLDVGCSSWSASCLLPEPPGSSSHSSMVSARNKRNIHDAVGSIASPSVCKGRRLVKKNAPDDNQYSLAQDYNDQDNSPPNLCNQFNNVHNVSLPNRTNLGNGLCIHGENQKLVDNKEVEVNEVHPSNDSNILGNDESLPPEETARENRGCCVEEKQNGEEEEIDEIGEQVGLCSSTELSCVICWTDFSSTRGVLPCGHRFCYSCIQGWANHMASMRQVSACPLCKASFLSIRKVEGAVPSDQKIYSQTLPCTSSSEDVLVFSDRQPSHFETTEHPVRVCHECHSREPDDLLLSCHICRNKWVHSFCLDPPLVPWTCIHCKDHRMLYQRYR